jgi:hypothetical protein
VDANVSLGWFAGFDRSTLASCCCDFAMNKNNLTDSLSSERYDAYDKMIPRLFLTFPQSNQLCINGVRSTACGAPWRTRAKKLEKFGRPQLVPFFYFFCSLPHVAAGLEKKNKNV